MTTRTLRYYNEIGLLNPAQLGKNGYRFYDRDSLLRLQQILCFRELDVPLKEIRCMMAQPDFKLLESLELHQKALENRASRISKLITLNRTIDSIQGEGAMSEGDFFEGFDEVKYQEEAQERWGSDPKYTQSQTRWSSYPEDQKRAIKEEGGALTRRMVSENPGASPDDPDVQSAVADYLEYLNKYFYTCDANFLRGLAENWVQDPRFAINYERIRPGGAEFVCEAIQVFCERNP